MAVVVSVGVAGVASKSGVSKTVVSGVAESVVSVGVVGVGLSISLSLPLGNMDDSSRVGNVTSSSGVTSSDGRDSGSGKAGDADGGGGGDAGVAGSNGGDSGVGVAKAVGVGLGLRGSHSGHGHAGDSKELVHLDVFGFRGHDNICNLIKKDVKERNKRNKNHTSCQQN